MSTPRERRHEITKQRILDAARKILVSQGLNGLSMRELAREIDYSPSAIYKYFASKEEILQAIRLEGFTLSNALSKEAHETAHTPPEHLLAGGQAYLRFAELYPEHYMLIFGTSDLPAENMQSVATDPNFMGLPQILADGAEQGFFRLPEGYTPELMAMQAWVTVHGMAMLRLGPMRSAQAEFSELCDHILRNFVASITVL